MWRETHWRHDDLALDDTIQDKGAQFLIYYKADGRPAHPNSSRQNQFVWKDIEKGKACSHRQTSLGCLWNDHLWISLSQDLPSWVQAPLTLAELFTAFTGNHGKLPTRHALWVVHARLLQTIRALPVEDEVWLTKTANEMKLPSNKLGMAVTSVTCLWFSQRHLLKWLSVYE